MQGMWCGVVWCGAVWCGAVQCRLAWRGVAWRGVVSCRVVSCHAWCGVLGWAGLRRGAKGGGGIDQTRSVRKTPHEVRSAIERSVCEEQAAVVTTSAAVVIWSQRPK